MDIFGKVTPPKGIEDKFGTIENGAIGNLLNMIFQAMVIGAGIFTLVNLLLAGYAFLSAGDDPKKIAGAWAKIWQSLLGLAVTAGAFVLAAIFGQLLFNDPTFILNPKLPTP